MKKVNGFYMLLWIGGIFLIGMVLIMIGFSLETSGHGEYIDVLVVLSGIAFWGIYGALPGILKTRMEKRALELEQEFTRNGFAYQYKFLSHNGVFYIGTDRRLAVIWRCNPFVLQFADSSRVTDIHTNAGQMLFGTSMVSCQFRLDGYKYNISTLRVSKGQLSMKDSRVAEAVKKADEVCRLIEMCRRDGNSVRELGEVRSDGNSEKVVENAARQDLNRAVQRFNSKQSHLLLLGTEQGSMILSTMNSAEGFCAVTNILKCEGVWKALRHTYSMEQGITCFFAYYDNGVLQVDFSQWRDVSREFHESLESDKRRLEG